MSVPLLKHREHVLKEPNASFTTPKNKARERKERDPEIRTTTAEGVTLIFLNLGGLRLRGIINKKMRKLKMILPTTSVWMWLKKLQTQLINHLSCQHVLTMIPWIYIWILVMFSLNLFFYWQNSHRNLSPVACKLRQVAESWGSFEWGNLGGTYFFSFFFLI